MSACQRRELAQKVPDLVANAPEHRHTFVLGTAHENGICKATVQMVRVAGINRTTFLCVVANGQDVIENMTCELVNRF